LAYGFTGLFLVLYAVLAANSFIVALLGSLLVWFILSTLAVILDLQDFSLSLIACGFILLVSFYVFERKLKLASSTRAKNRYSTRQILWRAAFGGFMVAFAVLVAKFAGPIVGGIFSAFPAVFISTLIISYQSRGIEFSRAITKPLMVTGMITIVMYGIGVRYFYPSLGLVAGTFVAYSLAMLSALFTGIFIQKKLI
jgi:uncharacterized membrane protein (GlpM family)